MQGDPCGSCARYDSFEFREEAMPPFPSNHPFDGKPPEPTFFSDDFGASGHASSLNLNSGFIYSKMVRVLLSTRPFDGQEAVAATSGVAPARLFIPGIFPGSGTFCRLPARIPAICVLQVRRVRTGYAGTVVAPLAMRLFRERRESLAAPAACCIFGPCIFVFCLMMNTVLSPVFLRASSPVLLVWSPSHIPAAHRPAAEENRRDQGVPAHCAPQGRPLRQD